MFYIFKIAELLRIFCKSRNLGRNFYCLNRGSNGL